VKFLGIEILGKESLRQAQMQTGQVIEPFFD
jgi:hypothetical protein